MEVCLEALLEMDFCTKPPNFGVDVYMEAPAGDALSMGREMSIIGTLCHLKVSNPIDVLQLYTDKVSNHI
jgi:hypothetical protein